MNFTAQIPVSGDRDALVAGLHDVAAWSTWMEGLRESTVLHDGARTEAQLVFDGIRRVSLRVEVDCQPTGIFAVLVEGDLSGVQVEARIIDEETGMHLAWDVYVQFPVNVPGAFITELQQETIPRWSAALVAASLAS